MDAFGQVVLVIFIVIRVMIAAGLIYLIYFEVRRVKRTRKKKEEDEDGKESGEHVDSSSRNRN
jgi:predicted membrane protein